MPPSVITLDSTRVFLSRVYSFMALGLAITGLISYLFYSNSTIASLIYTINELEGGGIERSFNWLGYVFLFAPLALIFIKSSWAQSKSYPWVLGMFIFICCLMGATLSSIFLTYDLGAIYVSFAVSTGTFLGMSFIGATTKTDLTKLGGWLISALWGVILATLINFFIGSETLDYIVSYIGVMIFIGLIAYDTQKMVRISEDLEATGDIDQIQKAAISGAFSLYLDFVNLFLFFLRIFGIGAKD